MSKLLKSGLIDDLDYHFSGFITKKEKRTLSSDELNAIEVGTALISRQVSRGNICLSKKDLELLKVEFGIYGEFFPSWDEMCAVFTNSDWCSTKNELKPVVFDGERFYLYRYWNYENRLASAIVKMASEKSLFIEKFYEAESLAENIFGESVSKELQVKATQGVFKNRFTVITGGPGTGKTTVIAKIISILWKLFPEASVQLAAPTGKAAARINEAMSRSVGQMGDMLDTVTSDKLKKLNGSSIHRLLGWTSKPGVFRHNKENPIEADLLIVDEASMVDLALMSLLLDAVKPEASIVLLGDKDQLTSVEAGNVLGDIFIAASNGFINSSVVTEFTESFRFKSGTGIGELAKAVNANISEEKLDLLLKNFGNDTIKFIDSSEKNCFEFIESSVVENFADIFKKSSLEKVFEILDKFRILCASRKGRFGVEEINGFCEKVLRNIDLIKRDDIWYHGRPIMVLENDYDLELFNGDCGLILENEGRKKAVFRDSDSGFKTFPISVLPQVETVYAMTIHKSQGSEYENVMIILPDSDMPILTKELIYTAITRAKKRVTLICDKKLFCLAAFRSAVRSSGLVSAIKHYEKVRA